MEKQYEFKEAVGKLNEFQRSLQKLNLFENSIGKVFQVKNRHGALQDVVEGVNYDMCTVVGKQYGEFGVHLCELVEKTETAEETYERLSGKIDMEAMTGQYIRFAGDVPVPVVMSVIASIQLADRHPNNNGIASQLARRFAEQLIAVMEVKYPELKELFKNGWDKNFDV
jgi:hypothetical protein